jgi:hypothetical protein
MSPVTVTVTRRDIAALNVRYITDIRRSRATLLIVFAAVMVFVWRQHGLPGDLIGWGSLVLSGLLGCVGALLASLLFSLAYIATAPSLGAGVLGAHTYAFTDNGLLETTSANETLIKWGGAQSVSERRGLLHIEVARGLFHLIPRRAFESDAIYSEFCRLAQRLGGSA